VSHSGWLKTALESFQVLLLDQRGTGLSSPITPQALKLIDTDADKADFLRLFRCDSIVRDAEQIRTTLLGWYLFFFVVLVLVFLSFDYWPLVCVLNLN